MTCEECIHKSVCYRVHSIQSDYARKCGDFVSGYKILEQKPTADVLWELRAEIPKLTCGDNEYRQALVKVADVIKCIDKHRKGENE